MKKSIYDFQVNEINGEPIHLSAYRGRVLLIVNTASACSYSKQFEGLQHLYEKYWMHGFELLGFPCNQFNGKEPGSNSEVEEHCRREVGVTFSLFEKIELRGEQVHPLFQHLTEQAPFQGYHPDNSDEMWMKHFLQQNHQDLHEGNGVKWNFSKFLIDKEGQVIARFEPTTQPADLELAIEEALSSN
ncbi:glutathione peroxidase [Paenibacillus glycanilyticus]|uniref:Glutathione peroxidase n=1 Tax=Paenibacillus glycanilyticus TaxID=126569 RepID=A0ABQ6GHZ1_9BACL|nr:glutathione peroxidase [Paenibacillus glycanilyticus]GLX70332.1 glutathione peroxidase [Paenibacillus glycanilyticus]